MLRMTNHDGEEVLVGERCDAPLSGRRSDWTSTQGISSFSPVRTQALSCPSVVLRVGCGAAPPSQHFPLTLPFPIRELCH